jgi:DNA-binding beta-propeller fold protein YncE
MRYGVMAHLRTCVAAVIVAGASLSVLAGGASAATFNASNTAQFEKAIGEANATSGANTIVLAGGDYVPTATQTLINTSGVQTVVGPSSGRPAIIDGASAVSEGESAPVFQVGENVAGPPKKLLVGNLTLKDVEITHAGGSGVPATEVWGGSSLTIEASTVAGNTGIGVSVEPSGTATLINSTLAYGLNFAVVNDGTTSISNSTVAFNGEGGLENAGTLHLTNTIVADNALPNCVGKATTSVNSLDSDGTCGVGALSNKNPLLSTNLTNNGGATSTLELQTGSPAIDAGVSGCLATDQRGVPRATPCSIGAVEAVTSFTPPVANGAFNSPTAVAVDPSGNIWVADSGNDRVVEFNSNREYVQQFGSVGSGAGQFNGIGGIAYDPVSNEVYVTDTGNHDVQYFSTAGKEVASFGTLGLGEGQFITPGPIAIDSSGHVWVLNSSGIRVQEFTSAGAYVPGSGFGSSFSTPFLSPTGLAISGGNLYVTESTFGRVVELTTAGAVLKEFGSLIKPSGIASDSTGNLYVTELGINSLSYNKVANEFTYVHSNNRVQEFSPSGSVIATGVFGSYGSGAGQFSGPRGLAVNSSGDVFVVDTGNNRLQEWVLP